MKKRDSAAIKLLQMVWDHLEEATGHSWLKLNHAMHHALMIAIRGGFRFGADDFEEIAKRFRSRYWIGDNIEGVYCEAVLYRNSSAYRALENKLDRKPFIIEGASLNVNTGDGPAGGGLERLVVGAEFVWKGERVTVTSFNDEKKYVTACTYKPRQEPKKCVKCGAEDWLNATTDNKIAKRFRITRGDLTRR